MAEQDDLPPPDELIRLDGRVIVVTGAGGGIGTGIARRLMADSGVVEAEELPGPHVQSRDDLRRFVEDHAWGHHASCSNKMGRPDDPMAVVDGDFRVYGTRGLRVVDASVFPTIPGFFIVTSVYMIAEKASDVILADARAS